MDKKLTIKQASQVTGLSVKAIASRIERGSLGPTPPEVVDGRRVISRGALVAAGLMSEGGEGEAVPVRPPVDRRDGASPGVVIDVNALFARNERLMEELTTHRLLEAQAMTSRDEERRAREAAEAALNEARARVRELEAKIAEKSVGVESTAIEETIALAKGESEEEPAGWWERFKRSMVGES